MCADPPYGAPLAWRRSIALALSAVCIGGFGHLRATASEPTWQIVLVLLATTALFACAARALAQVRLRWWEMGLVLGAAQLVVHVVCRVVLEVAVPGHHAASHMDMALEGMPPEHAAHMATLAAQHHASALMSMLFGHLVATVLAGAVLLRFEAVAWRRSLRVARIVLNQLTRWWQRERATIRAGASKQRGARRTPSSERARLQLLRHCIGRRGPPVLAR